MQPLGIVPPDDLIPIAEAMKKTNRSRNWIENHVTVYVVENKDKVSESEVMTALEDWQKPKPKEKKGE